MDGAEEVGCELVVAGCDAVEVLQSAEHALGGIAIPVAQLLFGSYSKTTLQALRQHFKRLSGEDALISLNWDTTAERTLFDEGDWNPILGAANKT